ncbi:WD40/YVTN/BNR-like repeat-containing protein [Limnoglobus roseus]|uniref:Photosynthesis system II assembly factor Ycf48/Hcf136-like domain-containing protein n=1 Tax=Limnoglobus roseus TaxID=2598579 RepID=A0A5C1ALB2_9BACT|nr:hypothetical protein [Limnoglobus roseus]QEL18943.1 hypothetical protein PX52LOC_05993 [Limnoglobus roseus]
MATSLFIAVGLDGLRMRSTDGRTWTDAQTGKEGESYRAAAFGNGLCVAVGSYGGDNILAATADGKTWKTGKHEAKYVKYFRGLTHGDGQFVALGGDPGSVGSSKPFVMFSKDGLTWDGPHDVPGKHILRRAAWGGGRFVAVGDRGRRATSTDGKAWQDAPETKAIDTLVDVTFGNELFVGVGLHGLRMASHDGLKWTARQTGEEGEHLNSIVFANGKFIAVGTGATYTSADGEKWERAVNENAPQVVTHAGSVFIGAAWKGRLLASSDGVSWKETHKADRHVLAVAAGTVG